MAKITYLQNYTLQQNKNSHTICYTGKLQETNGFPDCMQFGLYSMFHVTWTTFKFNKNQLGTVSAFVMISVPWSNQRAHQIISEKLLYKEFHCRTTDHK